MLRRSAAATQPVPGAEGKTFAGRRSLKLRGDVMECVAEIGSDQLKRADRGNRDQGGDEAVFDGSRAILVVPELHKRNKHERSPMFPAKAQNHARRNLSKP
jgi:hypothetical protein